MCMIKNLIKKKLVAVLNELDKIDKEIKHHQRRYVTHIELQRQLESMLGIKQDGSMIFQYCETCKKHQIKNYEHDSFICEVCKK